MNKLIKTREDRFDIINETGSTIAYVVKAGMGTHGHWRGWEHHLFCPELGKILWAGVSDRIVHPKTGSNHVRWTSEPLFFQNLKEIKAHYGIPA